MKKIFTIAMVFILTSTLFAGCGGRQAKDGELSGNITVSGAFALYPLVVKWAEEFREMHPAVRIDISAGGAGKGMTDALAKVADLGMVSRDIYPAEQSKGAVAFAVAKDAVVATINVNNPALDDLLKTGLTREMAYRLWIREDIKTWGQVTGTTVSAPVHVYTRSDACGAAETWAAWFGSKQEDLGGTAVFGDPGIASAVQGDKYAIGLNNLSYAYDEQTRRPNPGITVLPLDADGSGAIEEYERFYDTKDQLIQAIADGKYPSPPARDLYLVANGIPEKPAVREFLKYILTEGQKHNVPVGYIAMPEDMLSGQLEWLTEAEPQE